MTARTTLRLIVLSSVVVAGVSLPDRAAVVRAANPRTVLVVEMSYPMTITCGQDNAPAILWTGHGGGRPIPT